MDELVQHPCIRVRRKNIRLVFENAENIYSLFAVRLTEKTGQRQDVSKLGFVFLGVEPDQSEEKLALSDIVPKVQVWFCHYVYSMHFLILRYTFKMPYLHDVFSLKMSDQN
jgi:hypothetical protein